MRVTSSFTHGREAVTYMHGRYQRVAYDAYESDLPLCTIDKIGLHRIANLGSKPAISLHLYCPAFDTCATFEEVIMIDVEVGLRPWRHH